MSDILLLREYLNVKRNVSDLPRFFPRIGLTGGSGGGTGILNVGGQPALEQQDSLERNSDSHKLSPRSWEECRSHFKTPWNLLNYLTKPE